MGEEFEVERFDVFLGLQVNGTYPSEMESKTNELLLDLFRRARDLHGYVYLINVVLEEDLGYSETEERISAIENDIKLLRQELGINDSNQYDESE